MKKQHTTPSPPPSSPPKESAPEAPPMTPDGNAAQAGDDIAASIRAAEEEAKQHYEKLLRVMAEFDNFKKRTSKEVEERLRYANERVLVALLPTLDDLDRIVDHIPPTASTEVKPIAEGVELMRKNLLLQLAKFDLKEVAAIGHPFNPAEHEAIAAIPSTAHAPDTIVAVHRKGYWLGDRLLRPAMVTIAKKEDQSTPPLSIRGGEEGLSMS